MESISLFSPLLPAAVLTAEMAPADADPAVLHPRERGLIERAVEHRRHEFAAGRLLAHELLRRAGAEVEALVSDRDRVPIWPERVVGSITHCRDFCAVALAPRTVSSGIGIDIEPAQPLKDGIDAMILREAERARVDALPDALRPLGGILTFSIKEAVYKAIYPRYRRFLDFHEVEIAFVGDGGFEAEVLTPGAGPPRSTKIVGRYRVHEGHVASAVVLPPET